MASQFQSECPHCQSKAAGFLVVHQWQDRTDGAASSILAICGICNNGLVLRLRNFRGLSVLNYVQNSPHFPSNDDFVFDQYPRAGIEIPRDCPESVERFYTQGVVNLSGKNWDAAGAMFRKSLDVATKILAPSLKEKTLFSRINELVLDGKLTKDMGDWSHELRLDGNGSVHDENPETQEDAETMQKFAEAFLRYAFTLPNLVAENRQKRDSGGV